MNWLKYILIDLCAGAAIALLLRRFVCLLAYVKGRSMLDTLRDGEVIFAWRKRKNTQIQRFDVVLCRYPDRKGLFVKRVVGLPEESISIDEDVLFVNGQPVEEAFSRRKCLRPMTERIIPQGMYFVMGDNRPASRDSRTIGPVEADKIIAIAKCIVFPFKRIRKIR